MVELPDDLIEANAAAQLAVMRAAPPSLNDVIATALIAAEPAIAARVRAEAAAGECEREDCQRIAATASEVYCDITGGLLSYPTYDARTILAHANEQTQTLVDEECARDRAEALGAPVGPVSVNAVRDAAAALVRWCDDPVASPTVLGSILAPLVPAVRAEVAGGDRETLGRAVREEWVAWAREQPSPKPSWLAPWDQLAEPDREVDRRIGERLYGMGRAEAVAEREAIIEVIRQYLPDALPFNTLPEIVGGIARQRDFQHELKDHLAEVARRLTDERDAAVAEAVAGERQRIAADIRRRAYDDGPFITAAGPEAASLAGIRTFNAALEECASAVERGVADSVPVATPEPTARDERPHSRACGLRQHEHGSACAVDCPTCAAGGGWHYPVATPPTDPQCSGCSHGRSLHHGRDGLRWNCLVNMCDCPAFATAGPVATPTEPDHDMLDDVDRLRSMWRESPGTRAYVEDRYPGLAHAIERVVSAR